jgi:hypothetical protein
MSEISGLVPTGSCSSSLGYLFQNIHLDDLSEPSEGFPDATQEQIPPLGDVISQAIAPFIQHT